MTLPMTPPLKLFAQGTELEVGSAAEFMCPLNSSRTSPEALSTAPFPLHPVERGLPQIAVKLNPESFSCK